MTAVRFTLGFVLWLAAFATAQADERILRFVSDVVVERSGDLAVTETIQIRSEGQEIKRGILRDFPTSYQREDGTRVVAGFDVQSVTRDGAFETFATEGLANGVRVRIGNADRLLANGVHEYVIRYRTSRQVGFFASYDELYWNATGTGWTFPIDTAEARITLPEAVPLEQTAFYTGPQGAALKDAAIVEQQPGRIVFRTTRPLPRHNGLTVAASWPKGVVLPPSGTQQAGYWLQDNAAVAIALIGLPLLLLYYLFVWNRVGRDPPRGTIIPLFGPPSGMSAAAVRYVDKFGFDDRCFTAAIIELGVNGHLKIDGTSKKPILEHRGGGKTVGAGELGMEGKLFQSQSSLLLDQANYKVLGEAKTALSKALGIAYAGTLFRNNYGWSWGGFLLAAVFVFALIVGLGSSHPPDDAGLLTVGIVVPILVVMGGASLAFNGWSRYPQSMWRVLVGAILVAAAVAGGLLITAGGARGLADFVPMLAAFAAAAIAAIGFRWLKAATVQGRQIMDQIEGFRQYLGVAEESRLEALNPPDKTPELFERFLPYAVALDVQNTWAKRFAGVLTAAGTAAVVQSWYNSDQDWANDPVSFADHLGSSLNQTVASASTAPGSSSGSSGGGSSGGGGGGGGGSGW